MKDNVTHVRKNIEIGNFVDCGDVKLMDNCGAGQSITASA